MVLLHQTSPLKYSTLKSEVPRFDAKYYGASVRSRRSALLAVLRGSAQTCLFAEPDAGTLPALSVC